jgi:hypothetical protein
MSMMVLTLTQTYFHDGAILFLWCPLMKCYISFEFLELSQNSFHDSDSHEIANSHKISFMTVALTKYQDIPP